MFEPTRRESTISRPSEILQTSFDCSALIFRTRAAVCPANLLSDDATDVSTMLLEHSPDWKAPQTNAEAGLEEAEVYVFA
jgi:hypothetical protein